MSDIEQQNLYGGQGIVRFTLYPQAAAGSINRVQQASLGPDASIGRHCTPMVQRLVIGHVGEGEIQVDDVPYVLQSGVVLTVLSTQTLFIRNLSSTDECRFWIIQVTEKET